MENKCKCFQSKSQSLCSQTSTTKTACHDNLKLCKGLYIPPFIPVKRKLNINQVSTFLNEHLYICLPNQFTDQKSRLYPADTKDVVLGMVPNVDYLRIKYDNYVYRLPGILTISKITPTNISFEISYILAAYTDIVNYKIYFDPRYINIPNEISTSTTINGSRLKYVEFPYDETTDTYDTSKVFEMTLKSNPYNKNETGIVSYRARSSAGYNPTDTSNRFTLSYIQSKNISFPSYPSYLTGSTITNNTLIYNGNSFKIMENKSTIAEKLNNKTWQNFIGKPYVIHKFNIRL